MVGSSVGERFLVSQRSSFLVRYQLSENSYSSQLSVRNINIISTLYIGSPSSSSSVLPLIARLGSSSSVVRRQPFSVRRPSTVVFSPSSDRSASPLNRHRLRGSHVDPDRASSSSAVSQALQRAVVCWSEEDNSIPFITGFELSLKFPFDHFLQLGLPSHFGHSSPWK